MKDYFFNFQPHKKGLRAILGDLESTLMELIWARGPVTVREAYRVIHADREIAYTTVMTVMSRLAEKGLLEKEKEGNAFRYRAMFSEGEFKRNTLRQIMESLLGDFGTPAISQFVEAVGELDPENMDALAKLIEEKRRREDE